MADLDAHAVPGRATASLRRALVLLGAAGFLLGCSEGGVVSAGSTAPTTTTLAPSTTAAIAPSTTSTGAASGTTAGGGEEFFAAQLTQGILEGSGGVLTEEEATCIAEALIADVGIEQLATFGASAAQLESASPELQAAAVAAFTICLPPARLAEIGTGG